MYLLVSDSIITIIDSAERVGFNVSISGILSNCNSHLVLLLNIFFNCLSKTKSLKNKYFFC